MSKKKAANQALDSAIETIAVRLGYIAEEKDTVRDYLTNGDVSRFMYRIEKLRRNVPSYDDVIASLRSFANLAKDVYPAGARRALELIGS